MQGCPSRGTKPHILPDVGRHELHLESLALCVVSVPFFFWRYANGLMVLEGGGGLGLNPKPYTLYTEFRDLGLGLQGFQVYGFRV